MSKEQILIDHIESLSQIGTWELDLTNQQLRWSDGVFRMLGYAPQAFEVSFETGLHTVHPEDQERALAHMQEVLATDIPYLIEKRLLAHDGSVRHVRSKATVYRDGAGQATQLIGVFQDITDFVQAQQKLKQQESHLNTIIDSAPACIKVVSPEGILTNMNPAGLNMIEASDDRSKALGKAVIELIHPEDRATFQALHDQALHGVEGVAQFRIRSLKGTERWMESKSVPLKTPEGEIQGVLSLTEDISEKKRTQQALADSEHRFRALVENSADAVAIIQQDGYLGYISPSVTRILGYSEEEALALNLFEQLHPNDVADVAARMATVMQHPGVPMQGAVSRVRHKDGSWRWMDATITNLCDDPVINGIIDNFRDVTETRELQQLLDNATQLARVGGWEVDLLTGIHSWSGVTREIHEVGPDFVPDFENAFGFYKDSYRAQITRWVEQAIAENKPFDFEAPLITARGEERWVRAIGQAEFLGEQCVRIFGSIQDIHAYKMLALELEHKIKALGISNRELEQFAYIASHDLQEPLRMIDSFLTLLNRRYGQQLDSKAQQYIHFAVDGARRMRQVILALLDFSRVSQYPDHLSPCDLNALVAESLQLQRKLMREKQAEVHCGPLPCLQTYPAPLQQVFLNLIENALKYSDPERPPQIEIGAEEQPHEWIIHVKDNGIGISPEFFDKIFILFQRLHARNEYSGTGIGLAIVKKVIESLGGRVWLSSTPGEGSTFYFSLSKNAGQLLLPLVSQSPLSA